MKRRSFFGFMGGAAVAGPKLAQEMVSDVPPMLYPPVPRDLGQMAGQLASRHWRPVTVDDEIKELRSLLAGTDPQIESRRAQRLINAKDLMVRHNLDSLRSVSPSYKYQMLLEREEDRLAEQNKMRWQDRLASLLKD